MKLNYPTYKNLVIIFTFFLTTITFAQTEKNDNYKSKVTDPNANFFEIVAQKRAEFAQLDLSVKANNKAMKQFERWAYIWQDKVNEDGSFPNASNRMMSKEEYINTMMDSQSQSRSITNPWTQVGPVDRPLANGYVGYPGKGRVNVIAEDPTDDNIMYAGSAAGGIWKTTNNGALWSPKSDFLAGLGVTDILVDPSNSNVIYMATGDEDGEHISSIGVFKSIDAGDTWNPTGLTFDLIQNEFINDMAFAPGSSTTIFALTKTEIKRSTDSGATWTDITVTTGFDPYTEGFQNIVFDPNDAMKVVVSDSFGGLYFSVDGGATFSLHNTIQGLSSGQQKLKIVSSANDPDFFYGILEDQRNGETITEQASFRKFRYAFNNTAADLVSTTTLTGFNSQGGYNINIAVSPINKDNILVAGVNGFRSTDGGATFSTLMNAYDTPPGAGFYIHADHHHISFVGNTEVVLNGHDGGVHKGPFNATSATPWADISNTLVITQPYNISVTQEAMGDNFMMANQDNDGFSKILQGGSRNWLSAVAGDGTSSGIDIVNSDIRYLGGTNGQLYRADQGYADGYDQATYILGSNNDAAFVSQMSVHPTDANIIYACHDDVKKSTNKGGAGTGNFTALNSGLTGTKSIEVVKNDTDTSVEIYTIGNVGNTVTAKVSLNDGGTWTTITPPAGVVFNSFSPIPMSGTVYATASSYNVGNKVFKSTDNGASWTNISVGLPNIIMKKVVAHKTTETLYLGTELGPYYKENVVGATWEKMGTGLPNVRVDDLEINYTDNKLYIGTFGRGMWGIEIAERCTGVTKTWDGTAWSPVGAPTNADTVIINGNYSTVTNGGSIDACSLTISGTGTIVTVGASQYISVEHATIVDEGATLNIAHQGSFVQVAEDAKVTNNGSINVAVTTPTLAARDFMIIGSPMSTTNQTVFNNPHQVLAHNTDNYTMYTTQVIEGINFYDQGANDLTPYTGVLNAAEGYILRPSYTASGLYNYTFNGGTLNSGEVLYNAGFNANKNDSANLLSNPYASAIDANLFLAENSGVISEIYFWEHLTPVGATNGPYGEQNFSMKDISTYNNMGGNAAAANGGSVPTNIISSAQGFGIKANAAGLVKFTNAMRVTSANTTLRTSDLVDANRLWLSVNEAVSDTGSSNLIGFTSAATAGLDAGFDTVKLGTEVSLYTHLQDGTAHLAIQSREAFNVDMAIPMGFSTLFEDQRTYTISILNIEGDLITDDVAVVLIDNLLGTTTNLNDNNYEFTSGAGTYDNRFMIVFKNSALNAAGFETSSVSVFPNPTSGLFTINSPQAEITNVTITDVQGRIITTVTNQNRTVITLDLAGLKAALYFVNISTTQGDLVKQFIKK